VPKVEDALVLTKRLQSWRLVELSDTADYVKNCWAALRPLRDLPWEQYAQQRSDGFYAPPGFIPKFPEPKKWYQRQAGSNFHHRPFHPDQPKRLRILVRLSEAHSFEALNTVQDWFFVDLMLQVNEIPPTVGDLLFFTINAVGRDHSLTNLH